VLAKQTFDGLSHAFGPFDSGYFEDWVLLFAQASVDLILNFLLSLR
jgi:hypothetical protein